VSQRRIWAPRPTYARDAGPDLEEEAETLVRVLREQGPLRAGALKAQAEARYWGPGCFSAALAQARADGRVRRTGYRTYDATR
jgi:hypothetical protein